MIDHIVVSVRNLEASRRFYAAALAPLGYGVVKESGDLVGFGSGSKADLWIWKREPQSRETHVAFRCASRGMVDAFHAAALQAGARDNGAPGLRAIYHPDYYGAFLLDPDGNNIEAVCHEPVAQAKR
ncbi:MAG TPA: VOC family protein [Candidatus Polarisedimenticolia bacterium]|nr:VOC family protein [Candidatus Polarisedimenticolia bacterium]